MSEPNTTDTEQEYEDLALGEILVFDRPVPEGNPYKHTHLQVQGTARSWALGQFLMNGTTKNFVFWYAPADGKDARHLTEKPKMDPAVLKLYWNPQGHPWRR